MWLGEWVIPLRLLRLLKHLAVLINKFIETLLVTPEDIKYTEVKVLRFNINNEP